MRRSSWEFKFRTLTFWLGFIELSRPWDVTADCPIQTNTAEIYYNQQGYSAPLPTVSTNAYLRQRWLWFGWMFCIIRILCRTKEKAKGFKLRLHWKENWFFLKEESWRNLGKLFLIRTWAKCYKKNTDMKILFTFQSWWNRFCHNIFPTLIPSKPFLRKTIFIPLSTWLISISFLVHIWASYIKQNCFHPLETRILQMETKLIVL